MDWNKMLNSELFQGKRVRRVRGFEPCPISSTSVDTVVLPTRSTKKSAGYDIRTNEDAVIPPGCMRVLCTGITAYMEDNVYLDLRIRSGLAFKHMLTFQNDAGVIDADYYGNEIKIMMRNEGTHTIILKVGDRIAQGLFTQYLLVDEDKPEDQERDGGFGSTGVK